MSASRTSVTRPPASALELMPPQVGSQAQLLSIALAMERAAAQRYRELAVRMHTRAQERLAALFEFLASIEDKHAAQIAGGAADIKSADSPALSEQVPEKFETEEGDSALLTPYRALAIAVRNETRAFTYYSYIAATASNDAARKAAEELAKEELMHADLLRRERRKAYRAEKTAGHLPAPAELPASLDALWAVCFETEKYAAQYHRALAEVLKAQGPLAAAFVAAAQDEDDCARRAAERIVRIIPESPEEARPLQPTLIGGQRLLEEAFERYSDIAGRSTEEDVMEQAQLLAERAVRRLFAVQLSVSRSRVGSAAFNPENDGGP